MYVAVVPNRGSPPAILLRESYREAGKTKNRTLANLSRWPAERIEQLRAVLRGDQLLPAAEAVEIVRARPHGHVLAALGTARRIALDAVLPRRAPQRRRDLALALIVARLLEPAAKLATTRMLDPATASHSLGEMLELGRVAAKEVYAALDWLGSEQPFIEARLARRHLKDGALLLYDVTSTYLEGRCCQLAQHGYSRDHRADRPQIVIGLMCTAEGCPVAVEVFEGNTADPMTLSSQIDKLKPRFKLRRVVMVGDRGLLTSARIEQTLRPAGLDWITAMRAPRSSNWPPRAGRCSPRCLITATWPRSPVPTIRANAWWSAGTRCWPKSGPANARSCWPPPRRSSRALQPACGGHAVRCTAQRQSARPSAQCWGGATWPSISTSASPTMHSASPQIPSASPPRRRSTASMLSAPACRPHTQMPPPRYAPTKLSAASSTLSAR